MAQSAVCGGSVWYVLQTRQLPGRIKTLAGILMGSTAQRKDDQVFLVAL
jgi:hypothetical protein